MFHVIITNLALWCSPERVCRKRAITEPGSVFEPGCGTGVLASLLPKGCTYYGCDLNAAYVELALAEAPPHATFEVRDALRRVTAKAASLYS